MTKSFQKHSMHPLCGQDYSSTMMEQDPQPELEINETPALDLSCKKSLSSSPASDYGKDPRISPLRGSPYLENHHETNNNDNKHLNPYQLHRAAQQAKEFEHIEHSSAHHYQYDTLSFSSSNHERKSPFESRSYNMTPPSESDSPKKMRFQPIYTPNHSLTEALPHQAFPMHPINLPVPIMSLPVPVPAVMPTLLPQHNGSPPVSQNQMPTSSSPPESAKTTVVSEDSKKPRPFKAYPRDPMSITLGPDMMFDQELKQAYSEFRNRMLDSVKRTNEGTNIKMRRVSKETILPTSSIDDKDAAYWERRRKNNEAAKRSRDARRAKEDEIAIRAAFLEQEYIRLKYENAMLKEENAKIKCMLYGR